MNPTLILAAVDSAITVYEHAMKLLEDARATGVITVEEQAARLQQVSDIRTRVGLPPSP